MRAIRLFPAACILRPVSGFVGRGGVAIGGCGGGVDVFAPPPRPMPPLRMTDDRRGDGATATATTTTTTTSTTSTDDGIDRTTTIPPLAIASSPLPPSTFASQVERALLSEFPPPSKIERVLASWRYLDAGYEHREYVGDAQVPPVPGDDMHTSRCYQYAPSYVPGLRARTWWDDHDDHRAWARALADSYPAIRDEFERVVFASGGDDLRRGGNNVWAGALTSDAESYGVSIVPHRPPGEPHITLTTPCSSAHRSRLTPCSFHPSFFVHYTNYFAKKKNTHTHRRVGRRSSW